MNVFLIVVDGQNDFCADGNEPSNYPVPAGGKQRGALCVDGAADEARNVADMINRLTGTSGSKITRIYATQDSHHLNDGSHNIAWQDKDGNPPPPFTMVSHDHVVNGIYTPRLAFGIIDGKKVLPQVWALEYTERLAKEGRAPLILWPPHCIIGTFGHNFYYPIAQAFDSWCEATGGWIDYVSKGHWQFSEHYSGLRADVIDPTVPATQLNTGLIQQMMRADIIAWTGWAGSHCLRYTAMDALKGVGGTNFDLDFVKKSVFFEDASAAVPDQPGQTMFADWRKQFLDDVAAAGATVTTTKDFLK